MAHLGEARARLHRCNGSTAARPLNIVLSPTVCKPAFCLLCRSGDLELVKCQKTFRRPRDLPRTPVEKLTASRTPPSLSSLVRPPICPLAKSYRSGTVHMQVHCSTDIRYLTSGYACFMHMLSGSKHHGTVMRMHLNKDVVE